MAIKIIDPKDPELLRSYKCVCEILSDSEAEIVSLGEIVNDGEFELIPEAGSIAYTANLSAIYQMSPSGEWTKVSV